MAKIPMPRRDAEREGNAVLVPKGKYRVKVMAYEQAEGVSKKNDQPWSGLRVTLKFIGGEHDKHTQDYMLFDGRDAQISLFESAGYEIDRDANEIEVNLDDLVGLTLNVYLEVNKAGTYNNVVRFEPVPVAPKKGKAPVELPEDEEEEE